MSTRGWPRIRNLSKFFHPPQLRLVEIYTRSNILVFEEAGHQFHDVSTSHIGFVVSDVSTWILIYPHEYVRGPNYVIV